MVAAEVVAQPPRPRARLRVSEGSHDTGEVADNMRIGRQRTSERACLRQRTSEKRERASDKATMGDRTTLSMRIR
jgi:hypothetical protein